MTTKAGASRESLPDKLDWTAQSFCMGRATPKTVHLFPVNNPEQRLGRMFCYSKNRRRSGTVRFSSFSSRFKTWDVGGFDLLEAGQITYSLVLEHSIYYRHGLCPTWYQELGWDVRGYIERDGRPISWLSHGLDSSFVDEHGNAEVMIYRDTSLQINLSKFEASRIPVLICSWILAYSHRFDASG